MSDSKEIWPSIAEELDRQAQAYGFPVQALAAETARQRDAKGREEYGVPLTTDTPIAWLEYAVKEVADLTAYLRGLWEQDPEHPQVQGWLAQSRSLWLALEAERKRRDEAKAEEVEGD